MSQILLISWEHKSIIIMIETELVGLMDEYDMLG